MGKHRFLKKILALILLLLIVTYVIWVNNIFFSLESKIYFANYAETISVNRFWGLTSEKFQNNIVKDTLHYDVEIGSLLIAYYHPYGTPPFISYRESSISKENILLNQLRGYQSVHYEQYLIDLDVFNSYLKSKAMLEDGDIIDIFIHYIHFKPNYEIVNDVLHREKLYSNDRRVYKYNVWHEPRGLVDYCFVISGTKLIEVKTLYRGLRGDELYFHHDHRYIGKSLSSKEEIHCLKE